MRITFLSPANLGGGCRVVAIYAQRLRERGHQVGVIAARRPRHTYSLRRRVRTLLASDRPAGPASHFDHLDIPYAPLDYPPPARADDGVPDADVVVATWWQTAEWVAAMSPSKGAKVYFIQHHEIHRRQTADRVRATYRQPLRKITISHWLVDLMRDSYGDDDVLRVPNSVDTTLFNAPPRGRQAVPTVGLLYSHKHFKGLDVSLRAVEQVRRRLPALRLNVFCERRPEPGRLPPGTELHVNPDQARIKHIYAGCDVWLCGSRAEGFHLPPLEAMACRCPVVSTRVGGPLDIIEPGVNGFLADVEDADGLAAALLDVLQRPEARWRALSDAAYATASGYSWDDATDLFEQGLRDAVARGQPPLQRRTA